jgi:Cu/Ag efflux pump CusA
VIEREYKQVRGVADDSGFGGTVMQYQVLLDPARSTAITSPSRRSSSSSESTTPTPAADSIRRAGSSITCAAWA